MQDWKRERERERDTLVVSDLEDLAARVVIIETDGLVTPNNDQIVIIPHVLNPQHPLSEREREKWGERYIKIVCEIFIYICIYI
jgi:hypothetical protein